MDKVSVLPDGHEVLIWVELFTCTLAMNEAVNRIYSS